MMKYLTAIYMRISKADKNTLETNSIVNQRRIIESYIKDKNEIKVIMEIKDDGFSGMNFNRPGFNKMIREIEKNNINCVIVKDLSRFGRNYLEVGKYIERIFPLLGVRFISVMDGYDSINHDELMDLMLPFKNLINDMYTRDISIKIKSSLKSKKERGEYLGAFPPYGYKKVNSKLVIDENTAGIVKNICHMALAGFSSSFIAEYLNEIGTLSPLEYKKTTDNRYFTAFSKDKKAVWNPTAIKLILERETNENILNYNLILEKEERERLVSKLKNDVRCPCKKPCTYIFSGMVYCGKCGGNMVRKSMKKGDREYAYYVCKDCKIKGLGKNNGISEKKLENEINLEINQHKKVKLNFDYINLRGEYQDWDLQNLINERLKVIMCLERIIVGRDEKIEVLWFDDRKDV